MAHLVGNKRDAGDHLELHLLLGQIERLLRDAKRGVPSELVSVRRETLEQWRGWLEGALGE